MSAKIQEGFDAAMLEKPGVEGLTVKDAAGLYAMLSLDEAYPVEVCNLDGESAAMGFITTAAAERIGYEYGQDSGFGRCVSEILGDVDKESEDGTYTFQGIRMWLGRNLTPTP